PPPHADRRASAAAVRSRLSRRVGSPTRGERSVARRPSPGSLPRPPGSLDPPRGARAVAACVPPGHCGQAPWGRDEAMIGRVGFLLQGQGGYIGGALAHVAGGEVASVTDTVYSVAAGAAATAGRLSAGHEARGGGRRGTPTPTAAGLAPPAAPVRGGGPTCSGE